MPAIQCDPAKRRTHRSSILLELRELQLVAKRDCDDPNTKPAERAQLMRAYVALEQQRNVLRMKPTPKPMDVSELQRQRERNRAARQNTHEPGWRGKRKIQDAAPAPAPMPEPPVSQSSGTP